MCKVGILKSGGVVIDGVLLSRQESEIFNENLERELKKTNTFKNSKSKDIQDVFNDACAEYLMGLKGVK